MKRIKEVRRRNAIKKARMIQAMKISSKFKKRPRRKHKKTIKMEEQSKEEEEVKRGEVIDINEDG